MAGAGSDGDPVTAHGTLPSTTRSLKSSAGEKSPAARNSLPCPSSGTAYPRARVDIGDSAVIAAAALAIRARFIPIPAPTEPVSADPALRSRLRPDSTFRRPLP